ncbi:unnamed protein product [Prorocentrum cordatum]|uniref:Uncharacterized protein n=1 Tax=Prorocentrum cordatum TaxID=2364126 RepID=A0ABN9RP80_9DINO|nr:unnamed protein product [Polarella glacialis]
MSGDDAAYDMAMEVLFDIEMLSRARIVVGTLASQVTRVACSLGSARGTLWRAVALDIARGGPARRRPLAQRRLNVTDVAWVAPAGGG